MKKLIFCLILIFVAAVPLGAQWQISDHSFYQEVSSITLGTTAASTTVTCGYQGICITPILFNAGASYALSAFTVGVNAASGQIIAGIYSGGASGCPSGASFCANTLLCQTAALTPTVGSYTIPAASFGACGTFSPSVYYYLAVETSGSGVVLNSSTALYCPGTGYFKLAGPSQGSFALPTTMGTQTAQSGYCPSLSATFSCSGACGATATPWAVFTYAGNTSGTAVTTTNLQTGSYGLNGAFSGSLSGTTTYVNTPVQALRSSVNINGTTYTGGTLSIKRADATSFWMYAINGGLGGSPSAALLFWVYNTGNAEVGGDQFDLGEIGGGNTPTFGAYGGTANCTPGAPPCFRVERSGGTTAFYGSVPFSQSTWYALVIQNNSGGTHQAAVYDTTGTQIASVTNTCADGKTICIPSDASGNPGDVKLLCEGSCATDAGTWYYGPALFDPTGASFSSLGSTYGKMIFPDSPQVIGVELSSKVENGSIPHAELRNGAWWSFALGKTIQ